MFILLWGCQIDDDVHIDSNNSVTHNHYKLEKKSLDELLKNKLFKDSFQKVLKNSISFNSSMNAKTAIEQEYGFTINENSPINVISTEKATSYTFNIYSGDYFDDYSDEYFENLVIQTDSKGITKAYKFKYNLNNPVKFIEDDSSLIVDANIDISEINVDPQLSTDSITIDIGSNCITVEVLYCCNNGHGRVGDVHIAGTNCTNPAFVFTQSYTNCDGASSGGGSGGLAAPGFTGFPGWSGEYNPISGIVFNPGNGNSNPNKTLKTLKIQTLET